MNSQPQKSYSKPSLKVLGSFTELTQMNTSGGGGMTGTKGGAKNDGSGVPRSRL